MSAPQWSDDDLLRELGAALREEPVDESIIHAAQAAFTWRTVDAEPRRPVVDHAEHERQPSARDPARHRAAAARVRTRRGRDQLL